MEKLQGLFIFIPFSCVFPVCQEHCEQNVKYAHKLLMERKGHTHVHTPSLCPFLSFFHACTLCVCMNVYRETPTLDD